MWKIKKPYEKVVEKMQEGMKVKTGPTVTKEGYRTGKVTPLVKSPVDYSKLLKMDQGGAGKKDDFIKTRGLNKFPGMGINRSSHTGLAREESSPLLPDFSNPGTSRAPR